MCLSFLRGALEHSGRNTIGIQEFSNYQKFFSGSRAQVPRDDKQILSLLSWLLFAKCIDLLFCKFLFELNDLLSEVLLSRTSLILRFEHTLARAELELDRCTIETKYFSDFVLYISNIGEVKMLRVIDRNHEFWWIDINL